MARSTLIAVVAIACVAVTHALAGETADAESWNVDAVFATGDTNGDSVLDKHEFAWTMKHFGFEPKSSPAASAVQSSLARSAGGSTLPSNHALRLTAAP